MGVITYILLCGFPPFASESNDQDELFDQILSGKFEFAQPFWHGVSIEAKNLICYMLRVDAAERYSADDVVSHAWIQVGSALPASPCIHIPTSQFDRH